MREPAKREIFCRENKIDFSSLITAEQVHDTNIAVVKEKDKGKQIDLCDGLITSSFNIPLAIFTADCMPIFMAAKKVPLVGLIHAGWKGLLKGIVEEAVGIFKNKFGVDQKDILVSFGPHIQKCCYEVSAELIELFGLESGIKYLDLSAIASQKLIGLGIDRLSVNSRCSCHEEGMFFSYRREKTEDRMISVVIMEKRGKNEIR